MIYYTHLKNGLELLLKESHFSSAVAIQCWVKAGPLYEKPTERGLAHLIEHMLFKGTKSRPLGEIAGMVEACGGDINAYTTFDYTVYYLTLPSKHLKLGIDILADAIFNSSFDKKEFANEREVILEEIRRSSDDPAAKLGRKIFELCYAGTEAGRPIIGYEKEIKNASREKVLAFYDRWYRPSNLSFLVVGDFDSEFAKQCVEDSFGAIKSRPVETLTIPKRNYPTKVTTAVIKGDFKQPRLAVTFPSPPLEHFDTVGLDLAAFALGSGESSRFNRRLRDEEHVVTSVGATLFTPKYGGIFELHSFLNEDSFVSGLRGIARETMRLKYHEPVNEEELARARANLRADRVFREETVEGQARLLGMSLTTSHKHMFEDVFWTLVSQAKALDIKGAVDRWIDEERTIIVGLLPEDSKLTKKDLEKSFAQGINEGRKTSLSKTSYKKHLKKPSITHSEKLKLPAKETISSPVLFDIGFGKKLVYRQNKDGKLFALIAVTEGGLRGENEETAGLYNAVGSMIAGASKKYSYEKLANIVEGYGASLEGFSGKDSFGFELQCLAEYSNELIDLLSSVMLEPVFPEKQWKSHYQEITESLHAEDESPANLCMKKLRESIFETHPYRFSRLGLMSSVKTFNPSLLLEKYMEIRESGEWMFSAVGPMPPEKILEKLRTNFAAFNPAARKRHFSNIEEHHKQSSPKVARLSKDREQTHIAYAFPGLSWSDPDRAILDVLTNILGGHGGRLFKNLRDKHSLAYVVSPVMSYGCDPGLVGAYIACAHSKKEKALSCLKEEVLQLTHAAPKKEELERAINYIVGNHEMELQRSDSQAMTMGLMEIYGIGFDDFLKYPKLIEKVTKEDIVRVAQRLFVEELSSTVIVSSI